MLRVRITFRGLDRDRHGALALIRPRGRGADRMFRVAVLRQMALSAGERRGLTQLEPGKAQRLALNRGPNDPAETRRAHLWHRLSRRRLHDAQQGHVQPRIRPGDLGLRAQLPGLISVESHPDSSRIGQHMRGSQHELASHEITGAAPTRAYSTRRDYLGCALRIQPRLPRCPARQRVTAPVPQHGPAPVASCHLP